MAKTIHCGKGVDPDPNDLYVKLKYAIEHRDLLEVKYRRLAEDVRRNYSWDRVGDKLYSLVKSLT